MCSNFLTVIRWKHNIHVKCIGIWNLSSSTLMIFIRNWGKSFVGIAWFDLISQESRTSGSWYSNFRFGLISTRWTICSKNLKYCTTSREGMRFFGIEQSFFCPAFIRLYNRTVAPNRCAVWVWKCMKPWINHSIQHSLCRSERCTSTVNMHCFVGRVLAHWLSSTVHWKIC